MTKRATSPSSASPRSARPRADHPLVGKWYHAFGADGTARHQGEIKAEAAPGVFLVSRYEWIVGIEWTEHLVPLVAMVGSYTFYDTAQEMRDTYTALRLRHEQATAP